MAAYTVTLSGDHTLQEIVAAITGEEATGAEFMRGSVARQGTTFINQMTFNDLAPGQLPRGHLMLIAQGASAPIGKALFWTGLMVVAGATTTVAAYR